MSETCSTQCLKYMLANARSFKSVAQLSNRVYWRPDLHPRPGFYRDLPSFRGFIVNWRMKKLRRKRNLLNINCAPKANKEAESKPENMQNYVW